MAAAKLIYKSREEITGKHVDSGEWIVYKGELTVHRRKTYPVTLKLELEYSDIIITDYMDKSKVFKGNSISQVFGKVAKWYLKYGILFLS